MGKVFEAIDAGLRDWIAQQALFFVGTAPLAADGHVNVSPKGPIGSLRVIDEHTVAYLDVLGSGAETIAHLRENGRIVMMLCAFQGPPRIVRLHGRARVVLPREPEFDELLTRFAFEDPGVPESRRAIIIIDVQRIADSCGYGVPRMQFKESAPAARGLGRAEAPLRWHRCLADVPSHEERDQHRRLARDRSGRARLRGVTTAAAPSRSSGPPRPS